ncbi:hypothetical protein [Leptospira harrisiae]|uniref:hypothetical protein n=1 Tax=Leptospira harrisiae TaxID=2023189 RepID=UPI000F63DA84|nr:hypothetical protein [Leptospira harrisiae]
MSVILSFDSTRILFSILNSLTPLNLLDKLIIFSQFEAILKTYPWFITATSLLVAYISGHLIASISSLIGERIFVEYILGYPAEILFKEQRKGFWPCLIRKYFRPYSEDFKNKFQESFETKFKLNNPTASDYFWLSFEYVAQNCPNAFARSMHFLNLYGFNRNISYSFLLSALFSIIILNYRNYPIPCFIPIVLMLGSVPFYWNYLKLLRRLNDEVFRAFYSHSIEKKEP